jgi:hypothetical protein
VSGAQFVCLGVIVRTGGQSRTGGNKPEDRLTSRFAISLVRVACDAARIQREADAVPDSLPIEVLLRTL